MSIWVLVANASTANLYSSNNLRTGNLELVKTLEHPESRGKGQDLISDRPGNYQSNGNSTSAYERRSPKTIEAESFAIELCKELNLNRRHNDYKQLVIVASPKFYGLIQKHLDRHIPEIVHIPKDYTKCRPEQISKHIYEYIYE